MSRSKKAPVWVQGSGSKAKKEAKRRAAKAVRSADEPPAKGKAYRKEFNPWDITDWKLHDPKNPKARRK